MVRVGQPRRGRLRERRRDRHRAPERRSTSRIRLRYSPMHGQPPGRDAAADSVGGDLAAIRTDRGAGRADASPVLVRERLHLPAGSRHA